jgi:hypothetical protein
MLYMIRQIRCMMDQAVAEPFDVVNSPEYQLLCKTIRTQGLQEMLIRIQILVQQIAVNRGAPCCRSSFFL